MYYVYILKSINFDKHYVGQTKDLEKRLLHHNSNQAKWTKKYQPWNLVYFEEYKSRSDAMIREYKIKNSGSIKKFLESVLTGSGHISRSQNEKSFKQQSKTPIKKIENNL